MIVLPPYGRDYEYYAELHEEDRWIFNKLEICKRFGYKNYGPCGIPMPIGTYCIRPIINLNGMSAGGFTKKIITKEGTMICKPGYVWTKWETKMRSWVEYVDNKVSSALIQVNWDEKTQQERYMELPADKAHPLPKQLQNISRYMLVEYLGNIVIDIGPRHMNEDAKEIVIEDYKKFDPTYDPITDGQLGHFAPYMKRIQYNDRSYGWKELEVFVPRKIYK